MGVVVLVVLRPWALLQMDKIAAKEGALLKLRSQSENRQRHCDLEIARLTQDVALWRSTLMHAGEDKLSGNFGTDPSSRRDKSESELLAKLGSQWASTCSLLVDLQSQDKGRNFPSRTGFMTEIGARKGEKEIGASVVLLMRQMVEDVASLQQEMVLAIAEQRLLVCITIMRLRAARFRTHKR